MKKQFLILLILFSHLSGKSFANKISFTQISSINGLSQNTVRTIIEDNTGFIWAGTMDGLNRYDGNKIKTYRPQIGNLFSLSDHRIKDIFKDRDGLMWIKTYENRFSCYNPEKDHFIIIESSENRRRRTSYSEYYEASDGSIWLWGRNAGLQKIMKKNPITNFHEECLIDASPEKAICNFLFEDSQGSLWTGGEGGLMQINSSHHLQVFFTDSSFTFNAATEHNGKIWFATRECNLICYDLASKVFRQITTGIKADSFFSILPINENELLIITHGGVGPYTYDIQSGLFQKPAWTQDKDLHDYIQVIQDSKNGIWLHNQTGNLWYYNPEKKSIRKMRLMPEEITKTIDMERYTVFIDSSELIWITTFGNGLFSYEPLSETLNHYKNQLYTNSPASDFLLDITEDRYGNIWIGSEYAGIIKVTKNKNPIQVIRPEKKTALGRLNNVRTIFEDSRGQIWVGTKNGSLYIYDQNLSRKVHTIHDLNPYNLSERSDGLIWIATKGNGLYLYDPISKKNVNHFKSSFYDRLSLSSDIVYCILIDDKENEWFGSFGNGISLIKKDETGNITGFQRFFENNGNKSFIRHLFQDSKKRIWAGTGDGLICFYPDQLKANPEAYTSFKMDLTNSNSLSSNDIKTIFEDSSGSIWIGTAGGGLNRLIEKNDFSNSYFTAYTTLNGLADNFISGIQEHNGSLWISSENGISLFNKEDYSFMTYHFSENTYGNHFNENALAKTQDGTLLWGSLDGLLIFNPESFIAERSVPEVKIVNFQNEGLEVYTNDASFEKSITFTEKVTLSHLQNTFTIEFATLILCDPDKNKYSFMLENYDKKWSTPNHTNSVIYRNLPHGRYIFKVKGSNHDNIWNENITELEIIISPPFYKSIYAYILYLVLLVILLYTILYVINRMNILNNTIEMEKQLTNHKLRFFTNISHEFRTPLTIIRGVVEKLNSTKDIPPFISKQLNTLNRNSNHLSQLIDELLEFRKMQNNKLTLSLQKLDIISFAHEICNGFQEIAEQKDIKLKFRSDRDAYRMYFDSKKLNIIINNLLSNSLKFTNSNGCIEIKIVIDSKNKTCCISVKDNGIGIPKEKHDLIFSRFMQINFSATGTGVGLSLVKEFTEIHKGRVWYESNPEGGSIFFVELSTNQEIYEPEQFIAQNNKQNDNFILEEDLTTFKMDNSEIPDTITHEQKLLIIEDNIEISNFLFEEFSKYFTVHLAENGKVGIEKAIELSPDLIICDITMPEMNGFKVTKLLKSDFQTCHIPIILLTAHSSMDYQLEGIESGADAYIMKPFSIKYMTARVFKLIEQRETLRKRFTSGEDTNNLDFIKNVKDKEFYIKIDSILEDHYADSRLSVDTFAELAGISRTGFYKKVKGITGLSPNDLIKIKRLQKSTLLLLNTEMNMSQIADAVGINDPFYFSRCFKSQYNCTPTQYRQENLSPK